MTMKKMLLLFPFFLLLIGLCSCNAPNTQPAIKSINISGNAMENFSPTILFYEVEYDPIFGIPDIDDIIVEKENETDTVSITKVDNEFLVKVENFESGLFREYSIEMISKNNFEISSEIVNKNGAKGVLTLISDDGDQRTSDFLYTEIAPTYSGFKLTVALPTKKVATISTTSDGKAWLVDENGKYSLKILNNTYYSAVNGSVFKKPSDYPTMVDFWSEITSTGQIELASHSHTHGPWPATDDIVYENGKVVYPEESAKKEILASAQILRDLLGQESHFILRPGGTFMTTEVKSYFSNLVSNDSTFLGMRGSSGAPPFLGVTNVNSAKLNTVEKFTKESGRLSIATLLVRGYEAAFNEAGDGFVTTSDSTNAECIAAGISAWTQYVDYAMQFGSWASIGFHSIVADNVQGTGYQVYDSQVKALMDYVQPLVDSGDLWLASFSDAAKYYFEWSSASVTAKCVSEKRIEVTLSDNEADERYDEELTVKISVPIEWTSAKLDSYGVATELEMHVAEDGTHFVYANILPGDEISVITPLN